MMRYILNPLRSKWKGNRSNLPKMITLDDARNRNECYKCGAQGWTRSHWCKQGAFKSYTSRHIKREGSPAVLAHFIHQNEATNEFDPDRDAIPSDTNSEELAEFDSHFTLERAVNDSNTFPRPSDKNIMYYPSKILTRALSSYVLFPLLFHCLICRVFVSAARYSGSQVGLCMVRSWSDNRSMGLTRTGPGAFEQKS